MAHEVSNNASSKDVLAPLLVDPTNDVEPEYVNYIDVRLRQVFNLPREWIEPPTGNEKSGKDKDKDKDKDSNITAAFGAADAPAYTQHPFRYEVSLKIPRSGYKTPPPQPPAPAPESEEVPQQTKQKSLERKASTRHASIASTVKELGISQEEAQAIAQQQMEAARYECFTFTRGRLLQPLTQYTHYIENAIPPAVPGMDEVAAIHDVPAVLELPDNAEGTMRGGTGTGAGAAAAAVAVTATAASSPNGTITSGVAAAPASMALPTPIILWVANEHTDIVPIVLPETPPGKKKKRNPLMATVSNVSTAVSAAATATEASLPPPVPGKNDSPPCVLRVPLTAEQEAFIESLLSSGRPLTLHFKRLMKPAAPAEWEDLNAGYYEADIPIDLSPLTEPGSLHLDANVPLVPTRGAGADGPVATTGGQNAVDSFERNKKKLSARKAKSGIPVTLYEDVDIAAPHPYILSNTSAAVSLTLRRTLARLASDRVRPSATPAQLIPTRKMRATHSDGDGATADAAGEFAVIIESIARKILRDYAETVPDGVLPADATPEEKDAWRVRFLEFFQSTGQLAAYKSQLTPLVVRMVQQKFVRDPGATAEKVGELSNELYVYLLECMHSTLRKIAEEGGARGISTVTAAKAARSSGDNKDRAARRATMPQRAGMASSNSENDGNDDDADDRVTVAPEDNEELDEEEEAVATWKERAIEAEASKEFSLATKYHQARVSSYTGGSSSRFAEIWTDAAAFYVRAGDAAKAEQCYREAIACDPLCLPALLGYGMWLMAYNRLSEAAVFLHGSVDVAPQDRLAWGCIALLDDLFVLGLKEGCPTYAADLAKWEKEHRYAMQKALQCPAGAELEHSTCEDDKDGDGANKTTGSDDAADGDVVAEAERLLQEDGEAASRTPAELEPQRKDQLSPSVPKASKLPGTLSAHTPVSVTSKSTPQQQQQQHDNSKDGKPIALTAAEETEECLFLEVARYALTLHHRDLANICLARCTPGRRCVDRLYARLFVQGGQFTDAIEVLDALAASAAASGHLPSGRYDCSRANVLEDQLLVLRADCEAAKGHSAEAIRIYKEALCKGNTDLPAYLRPENAFSSSTIAPVLSAAEHQAFAEAYLRLGNLLMTEGRFRDALGVFTLGIQVWPCGLMWLGAGIAYYRAGDLHAAEECLNESNTVNPLNPRTWAHLALLCVRSGRPETEEVVQQAMIQGLTDAALWAELGRELLLLAVSPHLSEICLRKAIVLEEDRLVPARYSKTGKPVSALISTSKYHLSHALIAMHRWEEARQVMEEVAHGSTNEVLKAKAEEELLQLRGEM